MTPNNLTPIEVASWHEGAHALLCHAMGIPVKVITLDARGRGAVETDVEILEQAEALGVLPFKSVIASLVAGSTAERLLGLKPGTGSDDAKVARVARLELERRLRRLPKGASKRDFERCSAAVLRDLAAAEALCELTLRSEWHRVRKLADWLMQCQRLTAEHLSCAVESAGSPRPLVCSRGRLDELVKLGGDDEHLARSAGFHELVRLVTRAEFDRELEEACAAPLPSALAKTPTFKRPAPIDVRPLPRTSFTRVPPWPPLPSPRRRGKMAHHLPPRGAA